MSSVIVPVLHENNSIIKIVLFVYQLGIIYYKKNFIFEFLTTTVFYLFNIKNNQVRKKK